jgi:pyruvate dehydrogenase E1 component alpha subunit
MAVHDAATIAVARARAGEGPTLIECKTYRQRGHTERLEAYEHRTYEEIESWKEKDPITRFANNLIQREGQLSETDWKQMDDEILEAIQASVDFAKASPFPKPESAVDDIFA